MVAKPEECSTTPAVGLDTETVTFTSNLILPYHLIFCLVSGRSTSSPINIQYSLPPSCHRSFLDFVIVTTQGDRN
jgi:hypothetical protein